MNCKEAGFRAFYKHFSVFKITEKDKKILEGFPGAEQADYFLTYGYMDEEAEGCWVRLLAVNESTISGILLHDPNQRFKCRKGDIIEFRLQETDEKKIVCVKRFD